MLELNVVTKEFWDKVNNCQHEATNDYLVPIKCSTPHCSGVESHCKKCGVYISECGCGYCNGKSGWSSKRWESLNSRKK